MPPARVLHLIRSPHLSARAAARRALAAPGPTDPAYGALLACRDQVHAARAAAAPDEHRVVLIACPDADDSIQSTALTPDRTIRPPLAIPALAWTRLTRERAWNPTAVRLWSPGLDAVARGCKSSGTIEQTPWSLGAVLPDQAAALDPINTPSAESRAVRRAAQRAALTLTDRDILLVLLADPPAAADARDFAFLVALLEVGVGPIAALLPAGARSLLRARRFERTAIKRSALHIVEASTLDWLDAADAAILRGPRTAASLAAAHAALARDLPLVAPEWLAPIATDLQSTTSHQPRVFTTDGRTRTLLPAALRALHAAAPWLPVDAATTSPHAADDHEAAATPQRPRTRAQQSTA
ncbi:MAG: hypothetical protein R3B68_03815 [Phycisphaerales bacterium]